jgi:putative SOS response-associated peptidase YedK
VVAKSLQQINGDFNIQMAPIVRTGEDGERELVMARWGLPGPSRCAHHQRSQRRKGQHELFAFLTTEANAIVAPIHAKAMQVF